MADKWKRRAKERAERIASLESHLAEQGRYVATLQEHLAIAKRDMQQAVAWAERSEKEVERLRSVVVWYETTYGPQTELIDGSPS